MYMPGHKHGDRRVTTELKTAATQLGKQAESHKRSPSNVKLATTSEKLPWPKPTAPGHIYQVATPSNVDWQADMWSF